MYRGGGCAARRQWAPASLCLAALTVAAPAWGLSEPPKKDGAHFVIGDQTDGIPRGSQLVAADLLFSSPYAGFKSVIFGLQNGRLYVVRRSAGAWQVAPGWPQQLPSDIYASPAIGDVNGDGQLDIVVGYGSTFTPNADGGVRAYRRDGTLIWDRQIGDVTPGPANGFQDPVVSTPAIGNIDSDAQLEVVFGGLDHYLYVVNGSNGADEPGWPENMFDTVFSSPALFDLDGDGDQEIIVGIDYFLEEGGRLHVLRGDSSSMPGFPKTFDQVINSSPAIGDIDGDGDPEIVHGTGTFYHSNESCLPDCSGTYKSVAPQAAVYAWNCDGTAVAGWPVTDADGLLGQVFSDPALADITGDGVLDVVVTAMTDSSPPHNSVGETHRAVAIRNDGTILWQQVVRDFFNQNINARTPIVADVFSSAAGLEVLVPTNGEIAVFDRNGVRLTETDNFPDDQSLHNMNSGSPLDGVVAVDVENSGSGNLIEVLAVSAPFSATSTRTTTLYGWNPGSPSSTPPWGMFHQSPNRNGVFAGTQPCGSGNDPDCTPSVTATNFFTMTPCRAYDTRDVGNAPLSNGFPRTITLKGRDCLNSLPTGARAAALNITVVAPTGQGSVAFVPGNCSENPQTTTTSFNAGDTRATLAVLPLSIDGTCKLTARATVAGGGTVHLLVDVTGYFTP